MTFKKKLTPSPLHADTGIRTAVVRARSALLSAAFVLPFLTIFATQLLAQPKIILQTTPGPTEIPLQAASNVIIDPLTGDITAIPDDPEACTGTGTGACDAQVDVISFNVNPSTVSQGQTFVASFNQRGAWECERTGLPGTTWDSTWATPGTGQFSVIVGSAVDPATYTLTLTCRNGTSGGAAIDSLSRSLVVNASSGGGTPQFCLDQGRVPPSAWTQELNADASAQSKVTQTWISAFGGTGFPFGDGINMRIRSNRYAAFFFNTGTEGQSGQINFSDLGASVINVRQGRAMVSLSACPGDFLPQSGTAALCRLPGVGSAIPNFGWRRSTAAPVTACVLPPNAEFYLNVTFITQETEGETNPNNWDWGCAPDAPPLACGWRMTHSFSP